MSALRAARELVSTGCTLRLATKVLTLNIPEPQFECGMVALVGSLLPVWSLVGLLFLLLLFSDGSEQLGSVHCAGAPVTMAVTLTSASQLLAGDDHEKGMIL